MVVSVKYIYLFVDKGLVVQTLLDASVVNAKELVSCGSHVNIIRLTLGAFLLDELVNRFIGRRAFHIGTNDLKQRLSQMRGAAFGSRMALRNIFA